MASRPAARETALLTPEATPARPWPSAFITVVVSGEMVIVIPRPSAQMPGKNVVQ